MGREHEASEKIQLVLLALAPVPPSALFVATLPSSSWSQAAAAFLVTLLFAYMTHLLAALPILLLLKQFFRLRWLHFAIAGPLAILAVWVLPALVVPESWNPLASKPMGASLVQAFAPYALPCGLAAVTGVLVWFIGFRENGT